MTIDELFTALWADYMRMTPQAEKIHRLLGARGERVLNDHVALRTFDSAGGLAALAAPFEAVGYVCAPDRYRFADKKLNARYWYHPDLAAPYVKDLRTTDICCGAWCLLRPARRGLKQTNECQAGREHGYARDCHLFRGYREDGLMSSVRPKARYPR